MLTFQGQDVQAWLRGSYAAAGLSAPGMLATAPEFAQGGASAPAPGQFSSLVLESGISAVAAAKAAVAAVEVAMNDGQDAEREQVRRFIAAHPKGLSVRKIRDGVAIRAT